MKQTTRGAFGEQWGLRLIERGDSYGLDGCRTHDEHDPLVEFYDGTVTGKGFDAELGQYVTRYYRSTLLGNSWYDTIGTHGGLALDGSVPTWRVSQDDCREIVRWLTAQTEVRLSREWAISQLVERDVARWGEGERGASRRMRAGLSHGRALNSLAHYDTDNIDAELVREAQRVMTDADRAELRKGG